MDNTGELLTELYNIFGTLEPEKFNDTYVNLNQEERSYLYNKITRSNVSQQFLLTGQSGTGKTSFLFKLKEELENENYFVVYCPMEQILNLHDVHYIDIILGILKCVTETLEQKEIYLNYSTLGTVNLSELKDMVPFKGLDFNLKFTKIVEHIYYSDYLKEKVRILFDKQGLRFYDSINIIIKQAKAELCKLKYKNLVIIVDDLNKCSSLQDNHKPLDDLLIKYCKYFKQLNTNIILSIPVQYGFCEKTPLLNRIWENNLCILGNINIIDDDEHQKQFNEDLLKEIITKRVTLTKSENNKIFSDEALDNLLKTSGGNISQLFRVIQESCLITESVPIENFVVDRVKFKFIESYLRSLPSSLQKITLSPEFNDQLLNDSEKLSLITFNYLLYYSKTEKKTIKNPIYT